MYTKILGKGHLRSTRKIFSVKIEREFGGRSVLNCELARRWKPRFVTSRTFMYAPAVYLQNFSTATDG